MTADNLAPVDRLRSLERRRSAGT